MYAERLQTPHKEIAEAGVSPEPLLDSVRLKTIKAAYAVSDRTYEDAVEASYAAANLVRQTLRFGAHSSAEAPMHPDVIGEHQYTNCHGYSVITSEILDEIGVPHWIGYANQHSFLLLQEADGSRTNIIDTPEQYLRVDITKAMGGAAFLAQPNLLVKTNRLRGDLVLEASEFPNKDRALQQRPWMSFTVSNEDAYRYAEPAQRRRAHNLILRSYHPEIGRLVLQAYANFKQAIEHNRIEAAHEQFTYLNSVYPDIDRRNHLQHPTRLVRSLGRTGLLAEALDDIASIQRSTEVSSDLYFKMWPINQRRHLGLITGKAFLLDEAVDLYDELLAQRTKEGRSTAHIRPVLEKAKKQAQRYNKDKEEQNGKE